MREERKLYELMADSVLIRWGWDAEEGAGGSGTQGGPALLHGEEDVDFKYCCRTKSLYCHHDNAPVGNSLKCSLSSLILLPSRALRDRSHVQIYKETEYRVVCHENPIYIQRL